MNAKHFCGFAFLFWVGASPGFALETVAVNMNLTSPGAYNSLNSTVSIYVNQLSESKSGSSTLTASGTMLANLGITFDPVTQAVVSVQELEYTGGVVSLGSPHYDLDGYLGGFAGGFDVDGGNIQGTLDTPVPPGSVSGGNYNVGSHQMILNGGTISVAGSGLIGDQMDPNPIVLDLSSTQLTMTPNGTGSILVSLKSIVGSLATYDVSLLTPVNFDQVVYPPEGQTADASVTMAVSGTLQSAGQFTRVVPEPGTIALLLGMAACLAGFGWMKRRRS